LIFEKYKPQKGRSWYSKSTGGQKGKSLYVRSTDGHTLEWKGLIFIKGTEEQFLPIRKEPLRVTSVGKGRNRSSNTNGPQILITGPLRNQYKLRPSEQVKIHFSD